MQKYFGLFLVVLGIAILMGVWYIGSRNRQPPRTFSNYTLLTSSWEKYKTRFINADGRVIDYQSGDVTTSEGQSYALLQAVWIDDKATFDQVLAWTVNNLKRPNDHLFSWRWGKKDDGTYGNLPNGGDNSASDADVDIAFALLLASRRWLLPVYAETAKPIIQDIFLLETDMVGPNRYLVAGNWARSTDTLIINPSYFAPYAWRLFAQFDPEHDWQSLIDPAYALLNQATDHPLDQPVGVLPPDWVALKRDGTLEAPQIDSYSTNFSFDAIRIPWRIALDYQWHQEPQALNYLSQLNLLSMYYQTHGVLPTNFTHDGRPILVAENPATYATSLGYFIVIDPPGATKLYEEKIVKLYSNDTNSFRNDLMYYEENWLWFGAALYLNHLRTF